MNVTTKITELTLRQWDYIQDNVPDVNNFAPGDVRVCVQFELTPDLKTRHVEMGVVSLAGLLTVLRAIYIVDTAQRSLTPDTETGQDPLPVLPSADQVRNLAAKDAAELVRQMNADPDACGHHNPPHLYDCRATPEEVAQDLTGDQPSWVDRDTDDLLNDISEFPSTERPDGV